MTSQWPPLDEEEETHCLRDPSVSGACSGPGHCSCDCTTCRCPNCDTNPCICDDDTWEV